MRRTLRSAWKYLVPSWLSTGESELVAYVLTLLADASLERLYFGHLARFPQQDANGTPGPTDALDALGRDRGVIRGIDETDRAYAVRLTQWLVDARTRGTAFTLMKTLAAYMDSESDQGASFRVVDNSGNWFSRSSTGVETSSLATGNWNWDAAPASQWARFWVIIYPGTRWTDTADDYGDAGLNWAETNHVWGLSATPDQIATVRHLVNDWKPAGTSYEIIVALNAATFDPTAPEPDGTWDRWTKIVDGVAVPNRLSTGRYLGGA